MPFRGSRAFTMSLPWTAAHAGPLLVSLGFRNGRGLPVVLSGAPKDKRPRAGTLRAVYEDLIEQGQGHAMMLAAVRRGITAPPAIAVKYLELGAKVLDKTDDSGGKFVHFHLTTNVDFEKLRGAQHAMEAARR